MVSCFFSTPFIYHADISAGLLESSCCATLVEWAAGMCLAAIARSLVHPCAELRPGLTKYLQKRDVHRKIIDTIISLSSMMPVRSNENVIHQVQHFILYFKISLKPSALYFWCRGQYQQQFNSSLSSYSPSLHSLKSYSLPMHNQIFAIYTGR